MFPARRWVHIRNQKQLQSFNVTLKDGVVQCQELKRMTWFTPCDELPQGRHLAGSSCFVKRRHHMRSVMLPPAGT